MKNISETYIDRMINTLSHKYLNKQIEIEKIWFKGTIGSICIVDNKIMGYSISNIEIDFSILTDKDIIFSKVTMDTLVDGDIFCYENCKEKIKVLEVNDTYIEVFYMRGHEHIKLEKTIVKDKLIIKY